MLLFIACLFLVQRYNTSAAPVASSFPETPDDEALTFIRKECSNLCSIPGRSVWDILWSCLATTFAVTWVSAHPNVPRLEENSWSLLKRRMFLMCLALLAPEVMIMWAFKQWRGAVMIRETINEARPKSCARWSTTHAHFLQMGGFKVNYIKGNDFFCAKAYSYQTVKKGIVVQESFLNFRNLRELLEKQLIDFPETSLIEIKDRSKGDALSKGVALLQIIWFIVQLIARARQHLTITEIELTTAALAGLNSIMYLCWWSKPLDVRCPIIIRTKELEKVLVEKSEEGKRKKAEGSGESEDGEQSEGESGADGERDAASEDAWRFNDEEFQLKTFLRSYWKPIYFLRTAWAAIDLAACSIHQFLFSRIRTIITSIPSVLSFSRSQEPDASSVFRRALSWIWMSCTCVTTKLLYLPYLLMFLPTRMILDNRFSPLFHPEDFSDAKVKMHSKAAFQLLSNERDMGWIMSMMFYSERTEARPLLIFSALAGAAFGSIHCAAWHFDFPSVERILWRMASLSIVGVCLCIIAGIPVYNILHCKYGDEPSGTTKEFVLKVVLMALQKTPAIMYSFARLSLLFLSLLSLRVLPNSAVETVTWTELIPHI